MTDDRQRITDPGHERRYFTMVPHLVTDMLDAGELAPLAFAMYVHFRRHCGEHGDEYIESLRQTAKALGCSVGSAFTARRQLDDATLIDLHLEGPEGHESAHITVVDVWPENMARYAAHGRADGLRSNIERKSRRAFSGDRTQTPLSVQPSPDASVQYLNAARPLTGEPEEPEKPEEPEEGKSALARDDDPVTQTLTYRIKRFAREFDDPAVNACLSHARRLYDASGLSIEHFDNACKLAAHDTRKRLTDDSKPRVGAPMAYFFHALGTAAADKQHDLAARAAEQDSA